MDIEQEIWKPISCISSGQYQVSNLGNIRNTKRKGIMKLGKTSGHGYLTCTVGGRKEIKLLLVHRVVAEAFILNPKRKRTVNHKNGIKHDNRVENLEWNTYKENLKHAKDKGLNKCHGEGARHSKLSISDVKSIRKLRSKGLSYAKIGRKYKVIGGTVRAIIKGINWKRY